MKNFFVLVLVGLTVMAVKGCRKSTPFSSFITRHSKRTQILWPGSYSTNGKAITVDMCEQSPLEFIGEVQLTTRIITGSIQGIECSCFIESSNSGFTVLMNDDIETDKCSFDTLQIDKNILHCDGDISESIHAYNDKIETPMHKAFVSITNKERYRVWMTINSTETATVQCGGSPSPKPSSPTPPAVTPSRHTQQPSNQPGPSTTTGRTTTRIEMCKNEKHEFRNNIIMTASIVNGEGFDSCWCFIESTSKNPYLISAILQEECLFDTLEINNKQVPCRKMDNFQHKGSKTLIWLKPKTGNGNLQQPLFTLFPTDQVTIRCDGKRTILQHPKVEQEQVQVTINDEGRGRKYIVQCSDSGYIIGLAIACWVTLGLVALSFVCQMISYKGLMDAIDSVKQSWQEHVTLTVDRNTDERINIEEDQASPTPLSRSDVDTERRINRSSNSGNASSTLERLLPE